MAVFSNNLKDKEIERLKAELAQHAQQPASASQQAQHEQEVTQLKQQRANLSVQRDKLLAQLRSTREWCCLCGRRGGRLAPQQRSAHAWYSSQGEGWQMIIWACGYADAQVYACQVVATGEARIWPVQGVAAGGGLDRAGRSAWLAASEEEEEEERWVWACCLLVSILSNPSVLLPRPAPRATHPPSARPRAITLPLSDPHPCHAHPPAP